MKKSFNFKNIFHPKRVKANKIRIIFILVLVLVVFGWIFTQNKYFSKFPKIPITSSSQNTKIPNLGTKDNEQNQLGDFYLIIPKLDLKIPIIANVNAADKTAYNLALEKGVAQMKGSGLPGGASNIFIFGHSSFYANQPGNYKEIFATLNKLQENDQILVWYGQKEFIYVVNKTEIVDPTDVAIANPTQKEQLTLMTCWPPGKSAKRYVVTATPK